MTLGLFRALTLDKNRRAIPEYHLKYVIDGSRLSVKGNSTTQLLRSGKLNNSAPAFISYIIILAVVCRPPIISAPRVLMVQLVNV